MKRDETGRFVSESQNYGYYSRVLNKPFDTLEELKAAEVEFNKAHEAEIREKEEKKAAAATVNDAYKKYLEVCDQANKSIKEAKQAYLDARQKFIDKYNSFHMTYTNENGKETFSVNDVIDDLFNAFWRF